MQSTLGQTALSVVDSDTGSVSVLPATLRPEPGFMFLFLGQVEEARERFNNVMLLRKKTVPQGKRTVGRPKKRWREQLLTLETERAKWPNP
jgi:hypothetical protein